MLPELDAAGEVVAQGVLVEREHPAVLDQHHLAAEVEHRRVVAKDAERGLGRSGKPALHDLDALRRTDQAEAAPVVGEREERRPGVDQEQLPGSPSAVIAGLERVARQAPVETGAIVEDAADGDGLEVPGRGLDLDGEVGGEDVVLDGPANDRSRRLALLRVFAVLGREQRASLRVQESLARSFDCVRGIRPGTAAGRRGRPGDRGIVRQRNPGVDHLAASGDQQGSAPALHETFAAAGTGGEVEALGLPDGAVDRAALQRRPGGAHDDPPVPGGPEPVDQGRARPRDVARLADQQVHPLPAQPGQVLDRSLRRRCARRRRATRAWRRLRGPAQQCGSGRRAPHGKAPPRRGRGRA